jgi:hypothetical protein
MEPPIDIEVEPEYGSSAPMVESSSGNPCELTSADQATIVELVRQARASGVSLTGLDGLLKLRGRKLFLRLRWKRKCLIILGMTNMTHWGDTPVSQRRNFASHEKGFQ